MTTVKSALFNGQAGGPKSCYTAPVLSSLGGVQDFVLGALPNGGDADPLADAGDVS